MWNHHYFNNKYTNLLFCQKISTSRVTISPNANSARMQKSNSSLIIFPSGFPSIFPLMLPRKAGEARRTYLLLSIISALLLTFCSTHVISRLLLDAIYLPMEIRF